MKTPSQIILDLETLKNRLEDERRQQKCIVWTNGCFDIIHAGHIQYLKEAASLGDVLVVGLNSDESVRQLKGPERPVFPQEERAEVLSAIRYVDYITIYENPSPIDLLQVLKPDIYVKGGDYSIDTLNQDERYTVESYGGQVRIVSLRPNFSTTRTISRIRKQDE